MRQETDWMAQTPHHTLDVHEDISKTYTPSMDL